MQPLKAYHKLSVFVFRLGIHFTCIHSIYSLIFFERWYDLFIYHTLFGYKEFSFSAAKRYFQYISIYPYEMYSSFRRKAISNVFWIITWVEEFISRYKGSIFRKICIEQNIFVKVKYLTLKLFLIKHTFGHTLEFFLRGF